MSRTLTSAALQAIYAQETGEEFIVLLTLSGSTLPATIYVAGARNDVTSNGNVHLAFPFQITLPEESSERPPEIEIIIDNVDRQIIDAVRTVTSPITIDLSVVLGSAPDTVEAGPFSFTLKSVNWNQLTVTGRLSYESILDEPYPAGTYNPAEFPGLFK